MLDRGGLYAVSAVVQLLHGRDKPWRATKWEVTALLIK
jgi:hypothetical protein